MKRLTQKSNRRVRLAAGTVLGVYTVVVGILFIWQVLDLYLGGKAAGISPFTWERVGERVSNVLATPFWVWVALVVVGFIVWEVFPVEEKLKPVSDPVYILRRVKKRIDPESANLREDMAAIGYEERILLGLRLICILIGIALAVYGIAYFATPSNFPNFDTTGDMLNMVLHIFACAGAVFVLCCGVAFYEAFSAKRQLPHAKRLAAAAAKSPKSSTGKTVTLLEKIRAVISHKYFILGVRIAVGCIGVAFVIAGCLNGSVQEVFFKAINICTECIGLG